ncbi:MAG: thiamine pyrophosphate-dependent enzyme [Candidatus Brocadiales bacterium]
MSQNLLKYIRPKTLPTPFCPGCGHGILMGAILRTIDESDTKMDEMLFVSGIGCAAWIPSPHFAADTMHVTHGRPIAFATGAKLFNPKLKVMVISGDGDLASIGGNHLIHAARKNIELITICANNEIYGMTGGQVSSTTPLESITKTTPQGNPYPPFDLCKLVEAAGASFVARYSVTQPMHLIKAIKKALSHRGFSFIEVLTSCPVHYGRLNQLKSPFAHLQYLKGKCITTDRARKLTAEETKGKLLTGIFVDS